MYECPGCGANLKYDISSGQMKCEYCDSMFDPYSVKDVRKVEEHIEIVPSEGGENADDTMEICVYTCPQCGGEIAGDENEAATFCSFCGASTMMDQRMERALKPSKIVPFAVTKDDCARAYKSFANKAIFAPSYVKDPQKIDGFRGIYMPYWLYDFSKKGLISYPAKHTYQRGDYEYTDHYTVKTDADISYEGLNYDASSTFSDTLSNAIAPFDAGKTKEFTSAFMSGFYADVMDVDASVYEDDAKEAASGHAAARIAKEQKSSKYTIDTEAVSKSVGLTTGRSELSMMPVWFMSYRAKDTRGEDRVLYSVVNGQTGKTAGDMPVDILKYIIGSFVLAIPIFFLLNLVLVMKPIVILAASMVIMLICLFMIHYMASEVASWEMGAGDQGLNAKRNKERLKNVTIKPATAKKKKKPEKKEPSPEELKEQELTKLALKESRDNNKIIFWISLVYGVLLFIVRPINDLYFYIGVILTGITDCMMLVGIMKSYNRLTMRTLPQFKRKGGDDGANISKDI